MLSFLNSRQISCKQRSEKTISFLSAVFQDIATQVSEGPIWLDTKIPIHLLSLIGFPARFYPRLKLLIWGLNQKPAIDLLSIHFNGVPIKACVG